MGEYRVEYLDEGHIYLINGVIVPSVSKLVNFALGGNRYVGVPKSVLNAKASYGTDVHEMIQNYEEGKLDYNNLSYMNIDPNKKVALKQYVHLKEKYFINPKSMEQIVHYKDKFAGRYDILDKDGTLWDIKTTSKFHRDALEWQLSLYQLCIGKPKEYGYCIYLPKNDLGSIIQVKLKPFKEVEELIERYEAIDNSN